MRRLRGLDMIDKEKLFDKVDILNEVSMGYEVSVIPFFEKDYMKEFYDFYEIKNRAPKPVPLEEDFDECIKLLSGEYRWEEIAEKVKSLFGLPKRSLFFEEDGILALRDELDGPDGLAPFFFVFDIMFCEYDDYTLCYICGTNN